MHDQKVNKIRKIMKQLEIKKESEQKKAYKEKWKLERNLRILKGKLFKVHKEKRKLDRK